MTELLAGPIATFSPAETRQGFSPVARANIMIVNTSVKLGEFLQAQRNRDLAELESRGAKFKRVALMIGATVAISKSGISQDAIASLIRTHKV